jgi:hypothetical protein
VGKKAKANCMTEAAKAFEDRIKDGPFQKAKPFKYNPLHDESGVCREHHFTVFLLVKIIPNPATIPYL